MAKAKGRHCKNCICSQKKVIIDPKEAKRLLLWRELASQVEGFPVFPPPADAELIIKLKEITR